MGGAYKYTRGHIGKTPENYEARQGNPIFVRYRKCHP